MVRCTLRRHAHDWVSQGFRREYHKAQANRRAINDAACEACFMPRP
jgi:hypothetical protein